MGIHLGSPLRKSLIVLALAAPGLALLSAAFADPASKVYLPQVEYHELGV